MTANLFVIALLSFLACHFCVRAQTIIDSNNYKFAADGVSNDQRVFQKMFSDAKARPGPKIILIRPGSYFIGCASDGDAVPIPSNCSVVAYGAVFELPLNLPVPPPSQSPNQRIFLDFGVTNFSWRGGTFHGHAFDPNHEGGYQQNGWLPGQGVIPFRIISSQGVVAHDLSFSDITATRIGQALTYITGISPGGPTDSDGGITTQRVYNISLDNCSMLDCGAFFWTQLWLWQRITWSENYPTDIVNMAFHYMPSKYIVSSLQFNAGSQWITLDNQNGAVATPPDGSYNYAVSFFGTNLPPEIVKGKAYFLSAVTTTNVSISRSWKGKPITFSAGATNASMFLNLLQIQYAVDWNGGLNFGCICFADCKGIKIQNCKLSALGEVSRFLRCQDISVVGNQVFGSRKAGFYFDSYCSNIVMTGNWIDGGYGGRCFELYHDSADVKITGNVFTNGGHGCRFWNGTNIAIENNIFANNTTEAIPDWNLGQRDYVAGSWILDTQIAFYQRVGGAFSNVSFANNIIINTSNQVRRCLGLSPYMTGVSVSNNLVLSGDSSIWIYGTPTNLSISGIAGNPFVLAFNGPNSEGVRYDLSVPIPGVTLTTNADTGGDRSFAVVLETNAQVVGNPPISLNLRSITPVSTNIFPLSVAFASESLPPPRPTVADQILTVGVDWSLDLGQAANDPSSTNHSYELIASPPGLGVSEAGVLEWTPTNSQGDRSYPIVVSIAENTNSQPKTTIAFRGYVKAPNMLYVTNSSARKLMITADQSLSPLSFISVSTNLIDWSGSIEYPLYLGDSFPLANFTNSPSSFLRSRTIVVP